jgi:hypothetical protein
LACVIAARDPQDGVKFNFGFFGGATICDGGMRRVLRKMANARPIDMAGSKAPSTTGAAAVMRRPRKDFCIYKKELQGAYFMYIRKFR